MASRTLLSLVCFALIVVGRADAQVKLRYQFNKGQVTNYEMVQDMKMAQSIMGQNIETQMTQTIDLSMTVDDALSDGSGRVTTRMTRVRMKIAGPVEATIDSNDADVKDDNPFAKIMGGVVKTLAKVEFSFLQKPDGEMSEFKIPEAVLKEFKNLPGSAQMGDLFSEQGIKGMMSQSGLVFPKEEIKPGHTWAQKVSTKLPFGKMAVEMNYTYQGPETVDGKKLEKITYVPTSKLDAADDSPLNIKLNKQKGTGTVHFDNSAGVLQNMVMEQMMEMSVAVLNQAIDQTINQNMTMKRK